MKTAAMVSEKEYLESVFHPDQEYIDGQLWERNMGEFDHANLQTAIAAFFRNHQKQLEVRTLVEQRVQVGENRYRVPDICVLDRTQNIEQVIRTAPLLVVEILSPRDTVYGMQERIDDFLGMGVPEVWVIDPQSFRTWIHFEKQAKELPHGELSWRGLEIRLREIAEN